MSVLSEVQGLKIKSIKSDIINYEVGKRDVIKIDINNQGSKNNTVYKVYFNNNEFVFIGLLAHEIDYYKGRLNE